MVYRSFSAKRRCNWNIIVLANLASQFEANETHSGRHSHFNYPTPQDHLKEVLGKWHLIDDEIWGKIIFMEKNRRVAKAYARVPVLTISGSSVDFDCYRIGLNGFDNAKRDRDTAEVKEQIGSVRKRGVAGIKFPLLFPSRASNSKWTQTETF